MTKAKPSLDAGPTVQGADTDTGMIAWTLEG